MACCAGVHTRDLYRVQYDIPSMHLDSRTRKRVRCTVPARSAPTKQGDQDVIGFYSCSKPTSGVEGVLDRRGEREIITHVSFHSQDT